MHTGKDCTVGLIMLNCEIKKNKKHVKQQGKAGHDKVNVTSTVRHNMLRQLTPGTE